MQRAGADVSDVHRERARPVLFDVPLPGRLRSSDPGCRRAPSATRPRRQSSPWAASRPIASPRSGSTEATAGGTAWWVRAERSIRNIIMCLDCVFAADETGASAPTTAEQAQVLAIALEVIGIERPASFVGASYGAMVSLALAEAEPHRGQSAGCDFGLAESRTRKRPPPASCSAGSSNSASSPVAVTRLWPSRAVWPC